MGIGGISATSLLLILLIVVIIFGTKKLRNVGKDLGEGVKGFRKGLEDNSEDKPKADQSSKMSPKDDD